MSLVEIPRCGSLLAAALFAVQMLNTINPTTTIPINSTTRATGSYSSQFRGLERMTCIPAGSVFIFAYLGISDPSVRTITEYRFAGLGLYQAAEWLTL